MFAWINEIREVVGYCTRVVTVELQTVAYSMEVNWLRRCPEIVLSAYCSLMPHSKSNETRMEIFRTLHTHSILNN